MSKGPAVLGRVMALVLVVGLGVPGVAQAEWTDGDGTFRACVKKDGKMKLIEPGESCKKQETAIESTVTTRCGSPG